MKKIFRTLPLLFFITFVDISIPAKHISAQEPVTGLWIAQQMFDRDRGQSSAFEATMVLVNKNNKKKTRTFSNLRILEDGLERQLIRFTSPADIDGTGFLTVEKPGYETDQFLYLPALRRTRRIVSSQQSQRFVNSDFSYEEMKRHPVEDYNYEIKGETLLSDLSCYILETRPKENTDSQYSLTKSYVVKSSFVPIFIEFFDKKGKQVKTYKVVKLELKDNIWTEYLVVMEDLIRKHKTYIRLDAVEYNLPIDPEKLSQSSLENY